MRCHGEGGRERVIAGNARSTGTKLLISDQMLYPSRASLEAECPQRETRKSDSTSGDGTRSHGVR
jgi:hypothetical protein